MKLQAVLLLLALAAAPAPQAPPAPSAPAAPAPASPPDSATPPEPATAAAPPDAPASAGDDYTSRMLDPPLVPEYDPATAPSPAYAEAPDDDGLRECVGPDGVPIFTDRRCSDLGATPQLPPLGSDAGNTLGQPVRVRTCARNQDALLAGVRAALESHDANRLADYYHWTGMGSTEAYRLMDRLGAFSARPVVDVQLVRGAASADPYYDDRFDTPMPMPAPAPEAAPGDPYAPEAASTPPPRRRPHASMLRVDQMRSDSDVASEVTYFHLLTNAGCWWMRF